MKLKLLLASMLFCVNTITAQTCFTSPTVFPVDLEPSSLCYNDFNGDSLPDLAVANRNGKVGILLGDGLGGFGTALYYNTGYLPVAICSADFTGDNIADVATANNGPWDISLLAGNGDGTFGADSSVGGGAHPHALVTADFNGDNKADFALATQYSITVMLGDGAGHFADSVIASGFSFSSMITTDINGDSLIDLAMTGTGNTIYTLLGNGSGGFGALTGFASGGDTPASITAGDFNGDTKPDLATANTYSDNVSVLIGNGLGGFAPADTFTCGIYPKYIVSGDFNLDGKADLAVANTTSVNVAILEGDGAGSFSAPINFTVDSFPYALLATDLNGDAKTDLAVLCRRSNIDTGSVNVLLNCSITGIGEVTENDLIIAFPNPGKGIFTLDLNEDIATICSIEVYNALGERIDQQVRPVSVGRYILDISNQPDGVYFIRYSSGSKSCTKRVVNSRF